MLRRNWKGGVGARSWALTPRRSRRLPVRDDRGAAAVIVAVSLVALVGFAAIVVDVGSLYVERRNLQTAADAAALAGVQELPASPARAELSAENYVALNAPEASDMTVTVTSALATNDTVHVSIANPASPHFFARVWDSNSSAVAASATAQITSPIGYGHGVMPFGVLAHGSQSPTDTWGLPQGQYINLKFGGGEGTTGNYGLMSLEVGANWGMNDVRACILNGGSSSPVLLGNIYSTAPGNKAPTDDALYGTAGWIGSDAHHYSDVCDPPDANGVVHTHPAPGDDGQCHRLVVCPVVIATRGDPYSWSNGRSDMKVIGFAEFFVPPDSDLTVARGADEIWGRLVRGVSVEEYLAGGVGSSGQVHYALVK